MFGFGKKVPEKLNICFTSYKFPLSERTSDYGFLFPIAKGLVQAGHQVSVLSSHPSPSTLELNKDGVQIYYIDPVQQRRSTFPVEARKKFSELHKKNRFHIVHSVDSSGIPITRRRKLYRVATAFDVRGTQMSQLFSILAMNSEGLGNQLRTDFALAYKYLRTYWGTDRKILKSAHGVFVSSPQERIILERYYFYPDARIYTVPYGVQFKENVDAANIEKLKTKYNLTEDNQCVVTISDMTEIEDMKNLLLAFQKVAIKKPDARLIILGDGPLQHQLEYEVLSLALGNKVIMAGAVPDDEIYSYISLSHVFVNLSLRSTGFEPSLLVAMSQGKTIIGSEIGPLSSIVEDGIDGFLVRPADTYTLSQLILDIFRGQLNTETIGQKASEKVKNLFDTDKMVKNTLEAYQKILLRSGFPD
jgi:glycosyltransferase involved in cell wall biosynthesis